MALKNSIKILFNSFGLLWTIMVYFLVCGALILSLAIAALQPLVGAISSLHINDAIAATVGQIMSGEEIGDGLLVLVDKLKELVEIFNSPSRFWVSYLFIVIIVGILGRFLINLYEAPLINVLGASMSSKLKLRFSSGYINNLAKSCKMSLFKMIFVIPYDAFMWFIMYRIMELDMGALKLTMPFMLTVIFITGNSFKFGALSFAMPEYILGNKRLTKAFMDGVRLSFKNIGQIFSSMVLTFTTVFMINVFFGLFTFGAGLIITIPLTMIFINLLCMTLYYESNESRYYIDDDTIYTPKKNIQNA